MEAERTNAGGESLKHESESRKEIGLAYKQSCSQDLPSFVNRPIHKKYSAEYGQHSFFSSNRY